MPSTPEYLLSSPDNPARVFLTVLKVTFIISLPLFLIYYGPFIIMISVALNQRDSGSPRGSLRSWVMEVAPIAQPVSIRLPCD